MSISEVERTISGSGAAQSSGVVLCSNRGEAMITRDQAETMITMLDAGWTLAAIAAHFGVDVKEVEKAIVDRVRSERNQSSDHRRGK